MKTIVFSVVALIAVQFNFAQKTNPNYDETLATKVGADDYGMKSYIFVILKTGPNKTTDKEFINEHFAGHMSNMETLVKEDKLVVAGPFGNNDKTYRGLFILNVKSK